MKTLSLQKKTKTSVSYSCSSVCVNVHIRRQTSGNFALIHFKSSYMHDHCTFISGTYCRGWTATFITFTAFSRCHYPQQLLEVRQSLPSWDMRRIPRVDFSVALAFDVMKDTIPFTLCRKNGSLICAKILTLYFIFLIRTIVCTIWYRWCC